jgi:hypothetical protein
MDKVVDGPGLAGALTELCRNSSNAGIKVRVRLEGEPKMLKTSRVTKLPNPYEGKVTKVTTLFGVIGADYGEYVNTKLKAAGEPADFKPGARPWGEAIDPPLIRHKGVLYMQIIVEDASTKYYLEGEPVHRDEIGVFLPKEKPSGGGPGGVDVRTPKIRDVRHVAVLDGDDEIASFTQGAS